jgi:undecaprenyl-diphosphatase
MNYTQAIILGIIQGITEWLPISSSAHLALISKIIDVQPNISYFALLHVATIVSLMLYFKKEIFRYFIDFEKKRFTTNTLYIILATIPVFLIGFFFHSFIENIFSNFSIIGIALIVNSFILLSTKIVSDKKTNEEEKGVTYFRSLFIGVAQIFALIPGISRSGVTTSASIFAGLKSPKDDNKTLMMFVMMLSIPAILGAGTYEILNIILSKSLEITLPIIIGLIICTIVGFYSIKILVKAIKNNTISNYWVYCLVLGIILLFN